MKSIIDWNELVPRLPKKMRDDLYLEAVAILSEDDDKEEKPKRAKSIRLWEESGDGSHLAKPGRKFKILKNAKRPPNKGAMGTIWLRLKESHSDIITYEGLASICEGQKQRASSVVGYLWGHRFIDVVTQ
jgi:hypothetical protein